MTKQQATLVKLTTPAVSRVLVRKRVVRLLDDGHRLPLTWVSGPAGSGKTTAVATYLKELKIPHIWYQVDNGDEDIASFFYYMGIAAKKASSRRGGDLPLFTPEYARGLTVFARNYFRELCRRMGGPCIIVLDNYHEVTPASKFHQVVRLALNEFPESIRMIAISRGGPPRALAKIRASDKIMDIGWHDMRLSLDETKKMVRLRSSKRYTDKAIREIYDRTRGWSAGVTLLLKGADVGGRGKPVPAPGSTPEHVFDYFAHEVFEGMNKKTIDFLLKTSILPQMTPSMAKAITGLKNAGSMINELHCRSFFVDKKGSGHEAAYQYHPLFREFLFSEAKEVFAIETIGRLERKAATLLSNAGDIEDGARLFVEGRDWNGLTGLLNRVGTELLNQGRFRMLLEWLEAVPAAARSRNPWLTYWLGSACFQCDPVESQSIFEEAYNLFKAKDDPKGMLLSISGVLNSITYQFRDFGQIDLWMDILEAILKKHGRQLPQELEEHVALSVFLPLAWRSPDHPDFDRWKASAHRVMEKSSDPSLRMLVASHLLNHYNWKGDLTSGASVLETIRTLAWAKGTVPISVIMAKVAETVHFFLSARYDECGRAAKEGLKMARTNGVYVMDPHFFGFYTAAAIAKGDIKEACKRLERMGRAMKKWASTLDTALYHILAYWIAFLRGDMRSAAIHLEKHFKASEELGATLPMALSNISMAQYLHERGEKKKARSHLKKACDIGHRMESDIVEFMCLATKTQFAIDSGNDKAGQRELKKAFAFGRKKGYVNFFFLWQPGVMARLAIKALENNIETEYTKMLIKRRNLVPEKPPVEVEDWPWPVKVYTLGRFCFVKNGKPVKFSGKAKQKPLDLLKALVAIGGRDVNDVRLADALWPNAEGDAALRSLATTLHRLRQLLGSENAIERSEARITINHRYCWIDTWAFERIVGQIETALREKKRDKGMDRVIGLIDKAMRLYQGSFLRNDAEQPWLISCRERLRSKFLREIGAVCRYLCKGKGCEKAITYYNKGIELDDLAEGFYQGLMRCYIRDGRRAEAIAVYKRAEKAFSATLGVEPSAGTKALYRSITAGKE